MRKQQTMANDRLEKGFFERDTVEVAGELPGKLLVFNNNGNRMAAVITETEAYLPSGDLASHSAPGLTKRNAPMFESGGIVYIYKIYGVHYCFNIVTGRQGEGSAVLIRAAQPVSGLDLMAANRKATAPEKLCSGPGNFCKAFGFNLSHNTMSCCSEELSLHSYLAPGETDIVRSPRIGITKSEELLLRFYLKDNKSVSGRQKV